MSYPAAVGQDESRRRARACADEAIEALRSLPNRETLAVLADFAVTRLK
jgi:geranylgeranyl pyrophosphate synthase